MKAKLLFIVLIISTHGFSQNGLESLYSQISVNPAALDFDSTIVTQTTTLQTVVKNTGFGLLTVTDITSDNHVFDASPTTFTLANNQEQIVDVTFTPDLEGSFYGILSILNDSPTPLVEVICTGVGRWPLGINPLNKVERPYTLYPNPVKDQLNLIMNLKEAAYVSIVINDMTGKKRADSKIGTLESGDQAVDLSGQVQHLPSGLYLLHIRIGEDTFTEKIVLK